MIRHTASLPGGSMGAFFLINILTITGIHAEEKQSGNAPVQINNISIDVEKREIHIKTKLAIKFGILEFLLVDSVGRTYESAFYINNNKPSDLHAALLLLGMKPVPWEAFHEAITNSLPVETFLDSFPSGAFALELRHEGKPVEFSKLISCLEKIENKNVWVFTGSYFAKGNRYGADISHAYISVYLDGSAVINLYATTGNPYAGRFGFHSHGGHSWKEGEPFEIVLKPLSKKPKGAWSLGKL